MKITESSLNISEITDVINSRSPAGNISCKSRISDCFVYVLSGSAKYTFENKTVIPTPGDILYLPYKSRYDIEITVNNYTHIHTNFFFDSPETREIEVYRSAKISALDSSFRKLLKLWRFGNFSDLTECKSLLYHIYSTIISSAIFSYIPGNQRESVKRAVNLIHENYSDSSLTLSEIANTAEMSEVHFRRLFRQLYHTSPHKYIQTLKIEKAKLLLTDKTLSVGKISEECGFESAYYFSRVFRLECGITPSDYRASAKLIT